MNLDQYIGCVILWNGRLATVVGSLDCYDGTYLLLHYQDAPENDSFKVNAFDDEMLFALPFPDVGLLKRKEGRVVFLYDEVEYELASHPYEPCLYIKKDG